jgi:hypothetical protein
VFPGGSPVLPALRVESVVVARGHHELRVHRVVGAPRGAGVEATGWAVGPEQPLVSRLRPLHGWATADRRCAPAGTAFTPWARMPRLAAPVSGTAVFAALATLAARSGPDGDAPREAEATGAADVAAVPDGTGVADRAGVADDAAVGAVVEVTAHEGALTVRWAGDGAVTRISFDPLRVTQE